MRLRIAFVCGSRKFPYEKGSAHVWAALDDWRATLDDEIPLVLNGWAGGPDRWADRWAHARGVQPLRMDALWGAHEKAAGPIRNAHMADLLACVINPDGDADHQLDAWAYWDGHSSGTGDMINKLRLHGFEPRVVRPEDV